MTAPLSPVRLLLFAAAAAALAAPSDPLEAQRQPNIQLTFRMVEANGFETDDAEISEIVKELREIFRFDGYRLISTSVINSVPEGRFSQQISSTQGSRFTLLGHVSRDPENVHSYPTQVELVELTELDGGGETENPLLSAAVNMHDGQTIVLGSARATAESAALILVMTAKFSY